LGFAGQGSSLSGTGFREQETGERLK
jgi:hypothetical protein